MLCPYQNLKNLSDIEQPDFALFFINKIEPIIREIRMKVTICFLNKQDILFKSLTGTIDTETFTERFFFHVMTRLAETRVDHRTSPCRARCSKAFFRKLRF